MSLERPFVDTRTEEYTFKSFSVQAPIGICDENLTDEQTHALQPQSFVVTLGAHELCETAFVKVRLGRLGLPIVVC